VPRPTTPVVYLSGPSVGVDRCQRHSWAALAAGSHHTTPRKAETRPRWPQRGLTVAASSSWSIDDRQIPHLHPPTAGTPRPFARHALRGVRRRSQSCRGAWSQGSGGRPTALRYAPSGGGSAPGLALAAASTALDEIASHRRRGAWRSSRDSWRLRWFWVGRPTTESRTRVQVTWWARCVSNPRLSCLVSGTLGSWPGDLWLNECHPEPPEPHVAIVPLASCWQRPRPLGRPRS